MMLGSHTSHSYSRKFVQHVESVFRPTYVLKYVRIYLYRYLHYLLRILFLKYPAVFHVVKKDFTVRLYGTVP